MSDDEDRFTAEAAAWHAASGSDAMDWGGFTVWLEADPRNARAYDEMALVDALVDEHRTALLSAGGREAVGEIGGELEAHDGRRPHWGRWAGLAIAASLAAVFLGPQLAPSETVYRTSAQSRAIALDDGSRIILAPHSRLTVAGRGQDRLALAGGAWFHIRHDPSRAMTIAAGELEVRDIGTSFDIQTRPESVRIGVAEGEVAVASDRLSQPITLTRGRSLLFDEGTALVTEQPAPEMGSWQRGRLSYEDTPLPLVLDDLSRYAGVRVMLPESLRGRHFSGSLIISDGQAAIRDLAQVMGLTLDRAGDGYRLGERSR